MNEVKSKRSEEDSIKPIRKKSKKKVIIAVASSLVLVIVLTIVLSYVYIQNRPFNLLKRSLLYSLKAISEWDSGGLLLDVADGGSVELKSEGNGQSDIPDTNLKTYFTTDKPSVLCNFNTEIDSDEISGSFYLNRKYAYIESDELLSGSYGFDIADACGNLGDSFLAPGSGSKYELDDNTYNTVKQILSAIKENDKKAGKKDTVSDLADKYVDVIIDSVGESAKFIKSKETVVTLGEEVNATCISVHFDHIAMATFFGKIWNVIKDDKTIRDYIDDNYLDNLKKHNYANADALFADVGGMIEDKLRSLRSDNDALSVIDASVYIRATNCTIMRIDAEISVDSTKADVTLELGKNLEVFRGIHAYVSYLAEGCEEPDIYKLYYDVTDNTEDNYNIDFSGEFSIYDLKFDGGIRWNKSGEKYNVFLNYNNGKMYKYKLSGDIKSTDDDFFVSADSFTINGNDYLPGNITLLMKKEDETPKPRDGGYKDIIRLDRNAADKLIENVFTKLKIKDEN